MTDTTPSTTEPSEPLSPDEAIKHLTRILQLLESIQDHNGDMSVESPLPKARVLLRGIIGHGIASRAAVATPSNRKLCSELIHIAAELVRADGFLSPCDEPKPRRAELIKTAEKQDDRLKDWAYRVRQVANELSSSVAPPVDAECVCGHLKSKHQVFTDHDECLDCVAVDGAPNDGLCCEFRPTPSLPSVGENGLAPCPFCGAGAVLRYEGLGLDESFDNHPYGRINCGEGRFRCCPELQFEARKEAEQEAIKEWNSRAATPVAAGEGEQMTGLNAIRCQCSHLFSEHEKPPAGTPWDICSFPCLNCACTEFDEAKGDK